MKAGGILAPAIVAMALFQMAVLSLAETREFNRALATSPEPKLGPATTMSTTWYGAAYHGRLAADGSRFDRWAATCAHRTLPFGTRLRVEYQGNVVWVRVTDRGPLAWTGRDLDLSEGAFGLLAPTSQGVIRARVQEVLP